VNGRCWGPAISKFCARGRQEGALKGLLTSRKKKTWGTDGGVVEFQRGGSCRVEEPRLRVFARKVKGELLKKVWEEFIGREVGGLLYGSCEEARGRMEQFTYRRKREGRSQPMESRRTSWKRRGSIGTGAKQLVLLKRMFLGIQNFTKREKNIARACEGLKTTSAEVTAIEGEGMEAKQKFMTE